MCDEMMNFGLDYKSSVKFVTAQWQHDDLRPSIRYLIYRWVIASYFVFVFILSLKTAADCRQLAWYIIYLTNWNVIVNTISSLVMATVQTLHHRGAITCDNTNKSSRLALIHKIQWILWIVSLVVSVSITCVYWRVVYTGEDKGWNNNLTHGGNAVVNVIDMFIVAIPARFGLFVWPLGMGVIYALGFSLPYALAGGLDRHGMHSIYKAADWLGNPAGATIFVFATIIFLTVMHFVLTCFMILREKIHKRMADDEKKVEIFDKNQHQMESQHDNPTFSA